MAMTHFGSDIWSYTRLRRGAILLRMVRATIRRSACRGENRTASAPKRAMSNFEARAAIISMPQHAVPNGNGNREDLRAQFTTEARDVVTKLSPRINSTPIPEPL